MLNELSPNGYRGLAEISVYHQSKSWLTVSRNVYNLLGIMWKSEITLEIVIVMLPTYIRFNEWP